LGVIGASLGLAFQSVEHNFEIVGHDKEPEVAGQARKIGAVDRTDWNLISACEPADIIFLALPVMAVRDTLEAIAPYLKPGCIVTDTVSTKQQVLAWAEELLPDNVNFIGGDPLVGAEGRGIEFANEKLFQGALYCLTPLPSADEEALRVVAELVSLTGAQPFFIDPAEHDGLVAGAAQLPFIVSAALAKTLAESSAWRDLQRMAGYDFLEATAIAAVDPAVLRDSCLTNATSIARWIDACVESLNAIRGVITGADPEQVEQLFLDVQDARDEVIRGSAEERRIAEETDRLGRGRLRAMFFGSPWSSRR